MRLRSRPRSPSRPSGASTPAPSRQAGMPCSPTQSGSGRRKRPGRHGRAAGGRSSPLHGRAGPVAGSCSSSGCGARSRTSASLHAFETGSEARVGMAPGGAQAGGGLCAAGEAMRTGSGERGRIGGTAQIAIHLGQAAQLSRQTGPALRHPFAFTLALGRVGSDARERLHH